MRGMSDYLIRLCCRDDLEKVDQLEKTCFPDSPSLPMVALVQYFDLFQKTFVVAEREGFIIGFAIAGNCSLNPNSAWLLDAAVSPNHRKLGVANAMIGYLIKCLGEAGTVSIKATVSPKNSASRRMLEKCGFQTIDEVDEYFGKGHAHLLLKELRFNRGLE